MIIEIPIEILDVTFRVEKEDPLKPLMDVINSVKIVDSNSQSIHRLDAISLAIIKIHEWNILHQLCEIYGKESIGIYEKNLSLEGNFTGSIMLNHPKTRCEQIRRPSQGWHPRFRMVIRCVEDRQEKYSETRAPT